MRSTTLIRFALPALVTASLIGGCSGPSEPETEAPPVASLRSADPAESKAGDPGDQRPLIRLDATDEERDALVKVWEDCIRKTGGAGFEQPKVVFGKEKDPKVQQVVATCLPKYPETYEERQQRTDNAAFRDNQREWYRCAKEAGYKLNPPDETGEFGLAEIGPLGDFASPKIDKCRQDAFAE
jgi:hypothetical protein